MWKKEERGKNEMKEPSMFHPVLRNGIPEVTPADLVVHLGRVALIDVRRSDEFSGELGHIAGARLITLGPDLEAFLSEADRSAEIVFVCRSGARSGQATLKSREMGFENTINMAGGMLEWNSRGLPVER